MKAWFFSVVLGLALAVTGCHRHAPGAVKAPSPQAGQTPAAPGGKPTLPDFAVEAVSTQEGEAVWYDVPEQSLPRRKAWPGEMTAASDTMPQNSYARIRRIDGQGESVVVRITDSGVPNRKALVDVDRAAAEALGIVKTGRAQVRVETLALKNASMDKRVEKKNEPAAPKITDTPAASEQKEKDAADAKAAR